MHKTVPLKCGYCTPQGRPPDGTAAGQGTLCGMLVTTTFVPDYLTDFLRSGAWCGEPQGEIAFV